VGDAPSLETLEVKLDRALSNQMKMSLLMAGGWTTWPLKVPSNPIYSVISKEPRGISVASLPPQSILGRGTEKAVGLLPLLLQRITPGVSSFPPHPQPAEEQS